MWLINSPIGRKVVMSVTGICLILFLTFHCVQHGMRFPGKQLVRCSRNVGTCLLSCMPHRLRIYPYCAEPPRTWPAAL